MNNTQPGFNYVEEANITCSHQFHNNLVSHSELEQALEGAIFALQRLDKIKKALFYGRDTGLPVPKPGYEVGDFEPCEDRAIVHAIIGVATEAGEMLEPLYAMITGLEQKFDTVNLKEETGDVMWYLAVMAKRCGFTFHEVQASNIAKLRGTPDKPGRYKDKFDAYDANNRDLANERAILSQCHMTDEMRMSAAVHNAMIPQQPGAFDALPYNTSGEHIKGATERPNGDGIEREGASRPFAYDDE